MKARHVQGAISYNPEQFSLHLGEKTFFLDNAFDDWSKAEFAQKRLQVEHYIDGWFEVDETRSLAQSLPHLLPAVRNRAELTNYYLDANLNFPRDSWDGAVQPLCDCLVVAVAEDRPKSLALLRREKLLTWDTDYSTLLERAIRNLRAISPVNFVREPGGYYVSNYNDHHDAARLLLTHLFEYLDLKGCPVVIPVARNGIVVAGSDDNPALIEMARFAVLNVEQETRSIAYQPLILINGQWSKFSPEDPDLQPVRDLAVRQTLWDYERCRENMQKFCESQGRDVWVSKLEAHRFGEASIKTLTTWATASLLAKSDAIAFLAAGKFVVRSWDDVISVCGQDWTEEDCYPVRYFTKTGPSEEQLKVLEKGFNPPSWAPDMRRGA